MRCHVRELCLPGGICMEELAEVQNIVYARRRVKRGERLFRSGDDFAAVYAIRSGFFKVSAVHCGGREQVTGFFMDGELLGLEGIAVGTHNGTAMALEQSEVCVMPYSLIQSTAAAYAALQRQLSAIVANEIRRLHGVMMLLGCMRGEERLATFLSQLSSRFARRGRSPEEFHLRMTRQEIGSYLGLQVETVSRLFSQFQANGLISVSGKHVRILDMPRLENIIGTER